MFTFCLKPFYFRHLSTTFPRGPLDFTLSTIDHTFVMCKSGCLLRPWATISIVSFWLNSHWYVPQTPPIFLPPATPLNFRTRGSARVHPRTLDFSVTVRLCEWNLILRFILAESFQMFSVHLLFSFCLLARNGSRMLTHDPLEFGIISWV